MEIPVLTVNIQSYLRQKIKKEWETCSIHILESSVVATFGSFVEK